MVIALTLVLSVARGATAFAAEPEGAPLPSLKIVGIVPVQAENAEASRGNQGWEQTRKALDPMFSAAVRASRRFQTLNDDLVRMTWEKPAGREELVAKYEMDALVAASVSFRGEDAVLVLRVLSPKMENWLLETETLPRAWFRPQPDPRLNAALENLVFRTFNRVPVDVAVTSVQGRFVTLSGGQSQSIAVGDKVDLYRTSVATTHPVHGSWIGFNQIKLGEAKVVDVKEVSSVAQVTSLTYENAVNVGDGAKVPEIAARAKFRRVAEEDAKLPVAKVSASEKTKDVQPLYVEGVTPSTPAAPSSATPATAPTATASIATASENALPPTGEVSPTDSSASPPAEEPGFFGSLGSWVPSAPSAPSMDLSTLTVVDQARFHAGPRLWTFSGPVSDQASFPSILVNNIGGEVTRPLSGALMVDITGDLLFGSSDGGSYSGYILGARPFVKVPFAQIPYTTYARLGGLGSASGLGVDGVFGGGDWIKFGAFGALGGLATVADYTLDWEARLSLEPMTIGQVGFDNALRTIQSSMGYGLDLEGVLPGTPGAIEWGGLIHWDTWSITSDSDVSTLDTWAVQLLGRYRF